MKNDPRGEGPIEDREFMVPCLCLQLLSASQVKAFKRNLRNNPNIECPCPCPFQMISHYMSKIPDPFGRIAESAQEAPLRLLRARATLAPRKFLVTPLGELFFWVLLIFFIC